MQRANKSRSNRRRLGGWLKSQRRFDRGEQMTISFVGRSGQIIEAESETTTNFGRGVYNPKTDPYVRSQPQPSV